MKMIRHRKLRRAQQELMWKLFREADIRYKNPVLETKAEEQTRREQ
jgi:hypothetical protein